MRIIKVEFKNVVPCSLSRQLAEVLIRGMPDSEYVNSQSVHSKSQSLRWFKIFSLQKLIFKFPIFYSLIGTYTLISG